MRSLLTLAVCALMAVGITGCGGYANSVEGDIEIPQTSGPNPNGLPNANHTPKPTTPNGYAVSRSPVTIEEVLTDPNGPNTGAQYVELFNASQYDVDIGGWVLSDGNGTHTFPYGFTVPAGDRVLVHIGQVGADSMTNQFAASFPTLDATRGSLALLRSGTDVVDFVQWGGSPNAFESAADLNQEWHVGDFVALPLEGRSLNYDGTASDSTAWHERGLTPGQ